MTFTHFFADTSKAVPALQAVHDLSEPESVTSDLHETHLPTSPGLTGGPPQPSAQSGIVAEIIATGTASRG
jgi:hypothetical protein